MPVAQPLHTVNLSTEGGTSQSVQNDVLTEMSGICQSAITHVVTHLRIYLSQQQLATKQNSFTQKHPSLLDFSDLLRNTMKHFESINQNSAQHSELHELVRRCIEGRNGVSHQKFLKYDEFAGFLNNLHQFCTFLDLREALQLLNDLRMDCAGRFAPGSNAASEECKRQGNDHFAAGRYAEAVESYTQSLRIDSNNSILLANRAIAWLKLENYESARADAEDAISKDPSRAKNYAVLCRILQVKRQLSEAVAVCQRGLSVSANDTNLLLLLRQCRSELEKEHRDSSGSQESWKDILPQQYADLDNVMKQMSSLSPRDRKLVLAALSDHQSCKAIVEKAHRARDGQGVPQDIQKAIRFYEEAAALNDAEALFNLGVILIEGRFGTKPNPYKAKEYLERAAAMSPYLMLAGKVKMMNLGVALAQNSLGISYREGRGVDIDLKRAFKWFRKGARNGDSTSQNNLGYAYLNGDGVEIDYREARKWFTEAANAGITHAEGNLAMMFEQGLGGPVDLHSATKWYEKAAERGSYSAVQSLARLKRITQDASAAVESLRKSANKGNLLALFELGSMYWQGRDGVEKDLSEAKRLLGRAATCGHVPSQVQLGSMLLQQSDTETEGFEWIKRAAESGDATAQAKLATLYHAGYGTPVDAEAGRRWAERATRHESVLEDSSGFQRATSGPQFVSMFEPETRPRTKPFSKSKEQQHSKSMKQLPVQDDFVEMLEDMERRALTSNRARLYVQAMSYFASAISAAADGNDSDCVKNYYRAVKRWGLLPSHDILRETVKRMLSIDPSNSKTMFCRARSFTESDSFLAKAEYLEHCTRVHPARAEFHHLLGCCYASLARWQAAKDEFDIAMTLRSDPDLHYDIATCLSNMSNDSSEAITGYQEFLSTCEPDSRKVPEAHYSLSALYLARHSDDLAKEHYHRAVEAENGPSRLPCYPPVCIPQKLLVQMRFGMLKQGVHAKTACSEPSCSAIEKPLKNCSKCRQVQYCSVECQRKHWTDHKTRCNRAKQ
eukprot:GILJ01013098.1.p1 GENE.GILJ01013098.1~~GILJ01013098.1.p1  ORF type:complete len:1171 (+),score=101.33 GILJ01013098.1:479-3514(+)